MAALADGQYGVVTRRQLAEVGVGDDMVNRWMRTGRLHLMHAGVFALGHRVLPREGRWLAAVLACGEGAVLSHRSAAALWGVREYSGMSIDVTAPRRSHNRGVIRRHRVLLPADEVTVQDGIPVTTPPRTVFDLAAVAPHAVEGALRQAEYLRLHDPLSLPDLLARHPGRRGAKSIRAALFRRAESAGETRSALEERFLRFLDRHRLPRPQLNVWLEIHGRRLQVDCLWPKPRQVVELDGWQAHGTRTAFRDDRSRDRLLHAASYSVVRISPFHLDREPTQIATDLRALVA